MKPTTHNSYASNNPSQRDEAGQPIPKHIAIIMDGNRRWAKARFLPEGTGHAHVANTILEPLVEHAAKRGVEYLTFWAWSTENWRRKESEVGGILTLFREVLTRQWQRLHENGVRIKIIGDISAFPQDIQDSLYKVIEETANNTRITTVFALNYGGRDEIIRGITRYQNSQFAIRNSQLKPEIFSDFLDTSGIPDPDLLIRPGGEQRLSGFLLWQLEYAELYFPDFLMPEFTPERLDEALEIYANRKRNFGK